MVNDADQTLLATQIGLDQIDVEEAWDNSPHVFGHAPTGPAPTGPP